MVTIVGNVRPEDDYTHPLGPEENFNESVYFNFFDRQQQMGGFMRIGNRANEGYAEMTIIVYQPDGSALFNYKRPQIDNNDEWNAGGLRIEVLEPGERIRTVYEGSAVHLTDPREMREPGDAFKNNPHRKVSLDLSTPAWAPSTATWASRVTATTSPAPTTSSTWPSRALSKSRAWRRCRSPAMASVTTPGARATGSPRRPTAGSPATTATTWAWSSPLSAIAWAASSTAARSSSRSRT
ncbi:MAG: hypothetical protein U5Q44_07945 [Dehalococcoidia bacterium]|nr:hypothetical protein [Dehalococcoidia bacterium]